MTESEHGAWWESTPDGSVVELGFVKIDRVGSTADHDVLAPDDVARLRAEFQQRVDAIAGGFGAAGPVGWQGDGAMLFVAESAPPVQWRNGRLETAAAKAAALGLELLRSLAKSNFKVRIGVHCGAAAWHRTTGSISSRDLDLAGHLEHVAPPGSMAVSDDALRLAPADIRDAAGWLGTTVRDGTPTFVIPAAAANRANRQEFVAPEFDPEPARSQFLAHVRSPDVERLRYVGFRLHKRQPPSLPLLDVYTPPTLARTESRGVAATDLALAREHRVRLVATHVADSVAESPAPAEPPGIRAETVTSEFREFLPVFREARHLVVLGDPGAGKSTLLRWLAVLAGRGRAECRRRFGLDERLLPVLVSVGRFHEVAARMSADAGGATAFPDVVEVLGAYFHERNSGERDAVAALLRRELAAGRCLLLLDGLDEVTGTDRLRMNRWLEEFVSAYPTNRCVVSSRYAGFSGFDVPLGAVWGVQPFDDGQVEAFLVAWSRAFRAWENELTAERAEADRPVADGFARELVATILGDERLREMARNPLLLSMVALIHRAEGQLPSHRVQLFDIVTRGLCESWGRARRTAGGATGGDGARIDYDAEAVPVLGRLAFWMQQHHPTGTAPSEEVEGRLAEGLAAHRGVAPELARRAAREFLRVVSEDLGILLPRGPDHAGFLHVAFQEFLAAMYLLGEERFEEEMRRRWWRPEWLEVIVLGVGAVSLVQRRPREASNLVRRMLTEWDCPGHEWVTEVLRKNVALATVVAGDVPGLSEDVQREVLSGLCRWPFPLHDVVAGLVDSQLRPTMDSLGLVLADEWVPRGSDGTGRSTPTVARGAPALERHVSISLGWMRYDQTSPGPLPTGRAHWATTLEDPSREVPPVPWRGARIDASESMRRIASSDEYGSADIDAIEREILEDPLRTEAALLPEMRGGDGGWVFPVRLEAVLRCLSSALPASLTPPSS